MGGRGRNSGLNGRQLTIEHTLRFNQISNIIVESNKRRETMIADGGVAIGGSSSPPILKKCACCGEYTIPVGSEYESCPICGWIDDPYQNTHPESPNGKNVLSLVRAREEYANKLEQEK